MPTNGSDERLTIEIQDNVRRVDGVFSKIIKDRSIWQDFFRDPYGVLCKMGFSPPGSPEQGSKYNKLFYALITSTELLQFLYDHFTGFQPSTTGYRENAVENLRRGKIEYPTSLDVEALNHLRNTPGVYRMFLRIALNRINSQRVFSRQYSQQELEQAIEMLVAAAREGRSLAESARQHPWSDEMEESFQVFAAIPPAISAPVVAEAVAAGTVAIPVVAIPAGGAAPIEDQHRRAFLGETEGGRATMLLGLIFGFVGELTEHINQFERTD